MYARDLIFISHYVASSPVISISPHTTHLSYLSIPLSDFLTFWLTAAKRGRVCACTVTHGRARCRHVVGVAHQAITSARAARPDTHPQGRRMPR